MEQVRSCLRGLRKTFPEMKVNRVLQFYRRNNPAVLKRLAITAQADIGQGRSFARALVEHFLDLEEARRSSPDEYKRLLDIEHMENRCQELGLRIQQLRAVPRKTKSGARVAPDETRKELADAEDRLKALIVKVFTARQQNQLIAVNRLEAEVRELRKLIQQRDANRKEIVTRRLNFLTNPPKPHLRRAPPSVQWDW